MFQKHNFIAKNQVHKKILKGRGGGAEILSCLEDHLKSSKKVPGKKIKYMVIEGARRGRGEQALNTTSISRVH
jgi:hypothetical protein